MKIVIRHGNSPIRTHTCFKCNCEYQYDQSDVFQSPTPKECFGTGLKPCLVITCPECGRVNLLHNPNRKASDDKCARYVEEDSAE